MFRKKKVSSSSSKDGLSVPRAAVTQQQSVPLQLDINRSPLFARRHQDQTVPPSEPSLSRGTASQQEASARISKPNHLPLSVAASVPTTYPLEPIINISPIVTKVRTPQLKEVLGGRSPSDPSGSEHTSPIYDHVYEPGLTSSESSLTSPRQEDGIPLPPVDGELTPLTPISPLGFFDSSNRRASDFTVRSSQRAPGWSPTLACRNTNAVVFDNLQALLESPEAVNDGFPTLSVRSSAPQKLVTTRVSLIPHPPVEPVDISSIPDSLPVADPFSDPTAKMIGEGTTSADVTARKQQRPLPPVPNTDFEQTPFSSSSSLFPENGVARDQTDHTYQPIDRHSRSSSSNLSINSSLTRGGPDTGQTRAARIVNDKVSTSYFLQSESQNGSKNSIQTTSLKQLLSSGAPSAIPWSAPDNVVAPPVPGDLTRPSSSWSLDTQHRFTQFLSHNASTLSMLPQDKIETLFRQRYLGQLNLEEVLEEEPPQFMPPLPFPNQKNTGMSLESMVCTRCGEGFEPQEKIVNSNGQLWHTQCFVCSQCFRAFPDDVFYEFEGRRYCEHDFQVLFAPCCGKCNEFIIGRVIKAMNNNWHPRCFTCSECSKELADLGFIRNMGHAVCHDCNARLKAQSLNKYMCHKCHSVIDGEPLRWRGDTYHPYHFNCANCEVELTHQAREVKSRPGYAANQMNELYCLRCHDKMGIPICGACRRPIEERVVTALGKHWHVEHFVCIKCEKPFFGNRHYEKKGQAYCEVHYHELFGNLCFVCNQVIYGDVVTALNKAWCTHHFACTLCDVKMTQKTKFFEFDQKPICKKCYEKLPQELKKRLKRQHDIQARGGKPATV